MGQSISKASLASPLTLRYYLVNSRIDLIRYRLYTRCLYEDIYNSKKIIGKKEKV